MRVPGRQGIIASKFDGGDGFGFFKEAVQDFQGATAQSNWRKNAPRKARGRRVPERLLYAPKVVGS